MVGLIAVVGAGDPGRVVDVEPAPRPEHRAPVNDRDADGHQGDSKPSEQPGWLGAGSLGEAHQEPAVTTLKPGDCEGPAVAHHADPTVSFVVAALFAYSTLTAAAPLSEISPRLGLPSRPPRGCSYNLARTHGCAHSAILILEAAKAFSTGSGIQLCQFLFICRYLLLLFKFVSYKVPGTQAYSRPSY